ncbi:MAG: large-conductance mechanosensitive channel protein MscL [Fibrobacteraceae bacterium]|jgi:large conductance mechanosensitive channel
MNVNIKGKASSFMDEFKSFAFKGNVVDMAIGVIIGAAFGKIVTSMVNNIIMPVISLLLPSGNNYADWKFSINRGTEIIDGVEKAKVIDIPYGLFLSEIVSFVIVALVLFIVIKKFLGFVMNIKKAEVEATTPATPPPPSAQEVLLTEIRDLLKKQAQ